MRGQRKLAPELTLSAIHRSDNRPQYRRDNMTQILNLEALDGFILAVILEALRTAHPDHPALHLGTHKTPSRRWPLIYKSAALPE